MLRSNSKQRYKKKQGGVIYTQMPIFSVQTLKTTNVGQQRRLMGGSFCVSEPSICRRGWRPCLSFYLSTDLSQHCITNVYPTSRPKAPVSHARLSLSAKLSHPPCHMYDCVILLNAASHSTARPFTGQKRVLNDWIHAFCWKSVSATSILAT